MNDQAADAEPEPAVMMTQKRQRELEQDSENSKRFKAVIGSVAEEYVCPITTELPIDPVTAEDGNVYDRWAIEECIEMQGDDLKSPSTNLPMGPRLTPAIRIRNSIRKLIESGAIEGDVAKKWKERIKEESKVAETNKKAEESKVAETKKKAEEGDPDAMCDLGDWYYFGKNGLPEDEDRAYEWYKKASDLHSARGMAERGCALVQGREEGKMHGATLMGMAAAMGSDMGAHYMGCSYMDGNCGMPKDKEKAKYWLQKVVSRSCNVKHLSERGHISAKDMLEELEKESE